MFTFPTTLLNAPAGGGGDPWTPADITTAAWYDATTGVSDTAGAVDQWDDLSGNNNDLVQTGTNRPTTNSVTLNSLNVIDFDGSNDSMAHTASFATQPASFAAVFVRDTSGADHTIFDGEGASGRNMLRLRSTNVLAIFAGSFLGTDSITTGPMMASGVFDDGSSEIRLDGGTAVSGTTGTQDLDGGLRVGASTTGASQLLNGKIAEIVITDTALSTSDRQKLEGYLAWRWGLEGDLPGGHPYKSAPPTV
jgi:hypothetical protein